MAENQQRVDRRRRYFINKRLQGRFTACFLMLGLSISLGASMFIWRISAQEFDVFIYRSHLSPVTPWHVVIPVMVKAVVVSTAVLVISAYVFAHHFFRRISTRLLFFKDTLKEIGEGRLTGTPSSGIEELDEPLKLLIKTLKQDITSLQTIQKGMKDLVGTMEKATDKAEEKAVFLNVIEGRSKVFAEKLAVCRPFVGCCNTKNVH